MTTQQEVTISKAQARDWRTKARYRVSGRESGRTIGFVKQTQDSTRTGGLWSAEYRDGRSCATGFTRRADAVEALLNGTNIR